MRPLLLLVLVTGASGCVGPPSYFSPRSAASLEAEAAPTPAIGIALREDPPLPGGDTHGWAGLAPATPAAGTTIGGMDHSHMHHGEHGASGGGAPTEMEPGMTHGSDPATAPASPAPPRAPPETPASTESGGHGGH